MSAAFSVALPPNVRRHAEILGFACGLCCFPFAFFGETLGALLPAGPSGVVLPIVIASLLAGVITCVVEQGDESAAAGGFAPRAGMRAGVIAALTGGAVTVLAAALHACGLGHPSTKGIWLSIYAAFLPQKRSVQVLVLALLGVPPSIFFGIVSSLLTAAWFTPSLNESGKVRRRWVLSARLAGIGVFVLLGYLSPWLLAPFIPSRPVAFEPVVATPISQTPKWHYEKPTGFDVARVGSFRAIQHRIVPNVANDRPVALSPDGNHLACFQTGGTTLQILELDTLEWVAHATLKSPANGLSWSWDGKQLLMTCEAHPQHIEVFDRERMRLVALPKPAGSRLPTGFPFWWSPEEVLLGGNQHASALDLDMLRVRPTEQSRQWKGLSEDRQRAVLHGSDAHFAETSRWAVTLSPLVHAYDVAANPSSDWPVEERFHFAFRHPEKALCDVQSSIAVSKDDALLLTPDGSKLIQLGTARTVIHYFGTESERPNHFKVTMPDSPPETVKELLARKTLCAFVCTPMINPLNGKTVGPDRDHVKALARVLQWENTTAEFWIEDSAVDLNAGDVVADLHTWVRGHPQAWNSTDASDKSSEWFAVIESIDTLFNPPNRSDTPALDRPSLLTYDIHTGAMRFTAASLPPDTRAAKESPGTSPKNPPIAAGLSPELDKRLKTFVIEHHAKSSHGDVAGLVADYADRVDHFNNGIVTRDFIRKDEQAYHSPGTRVTETFSTMPAISVAGPSRYLATYSIGVERVQPDGHWTRSTSDVRMEIEMANGNPRIVLQHAQIRNTKKGP